MSKRKITVALLTFWLVLAFTSSLSHAAKEKFQDTFEVEKAFLADKGSNTYMILQPGFKLIFADGRDSLTITVLDETKMVDGVKTRIVEERETKGGKLEEVSRNYFAIDKSTGDIYYFGEDVDMYDEDGEVTGHEGSWLSGINDAKFGLIEHIEINYGTKNGKVVKLPKTMIHYAVEITRNDKTTEIVVDPEGTVIEPAKWGGTEEE